MKNKSILILIGFLAIFVLAPNLSTFVEASAQWHLPEGAKARLGKGAITEMQYSPDGERIAMASSMGIWLYDVNTDLLAGHTGAVYGVAFSPDGSRIVSGS